MRWWSIINDGSRVGAHNRAGKHAMRMVYNTSIYISTTFIGRLRRYTFRKIVRAKHTIHVHNRCASKQVNKHKSSNKWSTCTYNEVIWIYLYIYVGDTCWMRKEACHRYGSQYFNIYKCSTARQINARAVDSPKYSPRFNRPPSLRHTESTNIHAISRALGQCIWKCVRVKHTIHIQNPYTS